MIGAKLMEIPGVALKKFKEWSKFPEKQSNIHDKRIADALFHIFTKKSKNNGEDIEWDHVTSFIRRKYITLDIIHCYYFVHIVMKFSDSPDILSLRADNDMNRILNLAKYQAEFRNSSFQCTIPYH